MKRVLPLLLFFFYTIGYTQGNPTWGSYFSYNNIVDITQSDSRVIAAGESAMFYQDLAKSELNTITSVDGLKADGITAVHYSPEYKVTLVGNSTGLLIIIKQDNTFVNRNDIIQESTVPANSKQINDIYEYQGKAYLSCNFGVAVFDLALMEFGDTYYLGPNGIIVSVMGTAVSNGYIYAATASNGIRRGLLSDPNLNDFNSWAEIYPGNWSGVGSINNNLIGVDAQGAVNRLVNGVATPISTLNSPANNINVSQNGDYMVLTSPSTIIVYNSSLVQLVNMAYTPLGIVYTCGTVVNETLYIGTTDSGVLVTPLGTTNFTALLPDGPLRNSIFQLEKTPNFLWAVYGGYTGYYEPDVSTYGASKLTKEGWLNIPYKDLAVTKPVYSISDITVNPTNENEVYLSSYFSGLLKLVDDVPVVLYDTSNSSLEYQQKDSYQHIRVNGCAYDKSGALWVPNAMTKKPLKVLKGTQWSTSVTFDSNKTTDDNYGKIAIDNNNTKWIPSFNNGLIAFNEGLNNKFIYIRVANGLPSATATCVAIDNNNRVWIGTNRGLRVISSTERFMTEDELTATSIIILEDGLAQELMYEQALTDIVVDGSNNKWLATAGAGVFLVSPDGQQTLFHFTKDNSPLPSNNIYDVAIDSVTGEVFFATDKGMVSYKGTSTAPADDLSNVYVYPNPVRPGFNGDVKISGLMSDVNVKITDIEGNLVYETTSEGGTVLWDTTAFGKYKVASGVYMIFIASDDGTETKVKKVMIVR